MTRYNSLKQRVEGFPTCLAIVGLLVIVIPALAGCSGPRRSDYGWALQESEAGEYSILENGNEVARSNLEVRWTDEAVHASTTVVRAGEVTSSSQMKFERTTGELLTTKTQDRMDFAWGVERFMPSGHRIPLLGSEVADLNRPGTPLGPQWAAMAGLKSGANWGEISINVTLQGNHWALKASGPCQEQCGLEGIGEPVLHLFMNGSMDALLPRSVAYGFGDRVDLVVLERKSHAKIGGPLAVIVQTPRPEIIADAEPPCGFLPCEPPTWPSRISLKRGMDALEASVPWQAWKLRNPNTTPVQLEVLAYAPISIGNEEIANLPPWVLIFLGETTQMDFRLSAVEAQGTVETPPVLRQANEGAIPDPYSSNNQFWPTAFAPMELALPSFLGEINRSIDDVSRLGFLSLPQEYFVDARGSFLWVLYVGFPTEAVIFGSAITGKIISIQWVQ